MLVNADIGENVCIEISRQLLASLFDVTIPEHRPSGARTADLHRYTATFSHDIDHAGVPQTLHVRNHLARRLNR